MKFLGLAALVLVSLCATGKARAKIDAAYLTELARETDPIRFRARAGDLLAPPPGTTGDTFPLEVIVPALSSLRAPLRAWLPADPARVAREKLPEDQDRALRLLALLGDPRDDKLVEAWAGADNHRAAPPPRACHGPTLAAALADWESAHFTKEGYRKGQPRPFASKRIIEAPGHDHAVVVHEVRYANWGYNQYVVLIRTRSVWQVRRVLPHEIFHFRGERE
jgi:hypothetical protein